jgi:hypothetical protein
MTLPGKCCRLSSVDYLQRLYQTRDQYRANAERAIALGEFRKASELLWGAVTQQLKALAATHSFAITTHRQFFEFVRQLASDLEDRTLFDDFVDLNALHKNFYDEIIPEDAFPRFYEKAIEYIVRLEALAGGERE